MIVATLPKAQTCEENQRVLDALIPAGSVVLTYDAWWLLAGSRQVYDARWARPDMSSVDYIVLTGNGTGTPGLPTALGGSLLEGDRSLNDFRPIADNLNRVRPSICGFAITNSAYGFGSLVLQRIPKAKGNNAASTTERPRAVSSSFGSPRRGGLE
jgi:hypothetical protein